MIVDSDAILERLANEGLDAVGNSTASSRRLEVLSKAVLAYLKGDLGTIDESVLDSLIEQNNTGESK